MLDDDQDIEEYGRRLGHDFYKLTRVPRQPDWPDCVREGFDVAAFERQQPRRADDRFVRKWLQLRLNAWRRGRVVAHDVTPGLLRALDVSHCPILRRPLTHATRTDTDWSVDRLNNDAAYAASNLAVMSVLANRAKGALGFAEVLQRAEGGENVDGLSPKEWMRMAALMLGPTFATCESSAPQIPLCAPLPVCSVRLALQQIQRLWTEAAQRPAGKNHLLREFRTACLSEASSYRLDDLAEKVHHGLKQLPDAERWDVWLRPEVMEALRHWRETLDARGWARAAAIAGRLSGARRETPERLRAWRLPTRGYRLDAADTRERVSSTN
jgi:hypothetical protein